MNEQQKEEEQVKKFFSYQYPRLVKTQGNFTLTVRVCVAGWGWSGYRATSHVCAGGWVGGCGGGEVAKVLGNSTLTVCVCVRRGGGQDTGQLHVCVCGGGWSMCWAASHPR